MSSSAGTDQVSEWFSSIPPITKFLFVSAFATTCAINMDAFSIQRSFISWQTVWTDFEIWRLYTGSFFLGKFSFTFLTNLLFLYRYSSELEKNEFEARTADYAFCLTIIGTCLWLIALLNPFITLFFVGKSMIMALVYIWAQLNRDTTVSFFFGIKFKGILLPWVLMLFHLLMGKPIAEDIVGVLVGHLYYFIEYIHPEHNRGIKLIATPRIYHDWFPRQASVNNRGYGTSFQRQQPIDPNGTNRQQASGFDTANTAVPNPWSGGGNKLGAN